MAPTLSTPAGQATAGQSSISPSSNGQKPDPQSVRLFVGGLPADITVAELQARFKPFGTVLGMELVPQKDEKGACRGFAYVDLDPVSEASLHKCFTVYNGAKWRGGKLRVEKARATFLDRLKNEWDAEKEALDSANKPAAEPEKEKPLDGKLLKAKPIFEPLRLKWGSWEFEKREYRQTLWKLSQEAFLAGPNSFHLKIALGGPLLRCAVADKRPIVRLPECQPRCPGHSYKDHVPARPVSTQ